MAVSTALPKRGASQLTKLFRLWNGVQVELHGRYSLARLHALQHHAATSSRLRDVAAVVLSPLPCLVVVTAMDMLPVRSPRLGFAHQTIWIVFRVWFAGWIMAYMMAMQVHHSSPTLPLSSCRLWTIAALAGTVCAVVYVLLGACVAFPMPFATQLLTPPWFATLTLSLYVSWRHALRRDSVARANLQWYLSVFCAQVAIILVYTAYNIAFTTVGRVYQTYVALSLPLFKIVFKNIVHRGIFHMEDLAPTVVVLNVDVFHALFVSSTMQQAQTGGSVLVIMAVDIVQAIVASVEVECVVRRVRRNVAEWDSMAKVAHAWQDEQPTELQRFETLGLIGYAQYILDTRERVRTDPQLTQPRHLRPAMMAASTRTAAIAPAPTPLAVAELGLSVSNDQLQLRIVQDVLKLLHMVEFYVLIEFAEVVIAAVYTLYMAALSVLPIRAYYKPLAALSREQMQATIVQVAQYTAMEFVSIGVFCAVLSRRLRWGISPTQQLAFVLTHHARIVQTTLIMWVFFVAQLTFDHLGVYRKATPSAAGKAHRSSHA